MRANIGIEPTLGSCVARKVLWEQLGDWVAPVGEAPSGRYPAIRTSVLWSKNCRDRVPRPFQVLFEGAPT